MRLVLAAAVALLALPATSLAADPPPFTAPLEGEHPLVGRIWMPVQQRDLPPGEVTDRALAADAVLVGETHDNPDHHALQAWVVEQVARAGRRPAVAFEMIDGSQAPALAAHLSARPLDSEGLGDALNWQDSGWPHWSLYRPIAQAALAAGGTLLPANLSRSDVRAIAKGEQPAIVTGLGLDQPAPPEVQRRMEEEIEDGHCRMLPKTALPGMVRVQRARDAVMARAVAEGIAARGMAVLIAGSGHVRADLGVPRWLAKTAPAARVFTVIFQEARAGQDDPAAYDVQADVIWFTPAAERPDPCAAFRRRLEAPKAP